MSASAQEEFDNFYSTNRHLRNSGHPEDTTQSDPSDNDSTTLNEDEKTLYSSPSPGMSTATYLPATTQFDANTGPKGVIADARSFETAKKRSFRQTLYTLSTGLANGGSPNKKWREKSNSPSPDISADEEEDEFMRTWRARRLDELASMNPDVRTRRQSPSQRTYGSVVTVDPSGYLDAVEKVHACTTVVVLIYDDESAVSNQVEDALKVIARTYSTIRFVKLHVLDAEMDEIAAPGILAYRAGECFANLVSIIDEIPSDKDVSSSTLENVLQS
ncbi:hypothetical protein ACLMJK_000688 [Lecanora helva]